MTANNIKRQSEVAGKKKLAVIVDADAFDRKGLFNAVIERVSAMMQSGTFDVDFWCLQCRDNFISRRVRHTVKAPGIFRELMIGDVRTRLLWYRFSFIDNLLFDRLHLCRPMWKRLVRRASKSFEGYDVISAHSFNAASFAACCNVPFCITWHGSDIHTHPYRNKAVMKETRRLMNVACCNVFVSRKLMETSDRICIGCRKFVSSNGISSLFMQMGPRERAKIRESHNISQGQKVIGYVGNFMKVKNVEALPDIFSSIRERVAECRFICIGDGKLKQKVENAMETQCEFLGNVTPESMVEYYNILDLLVVPSLNEGFPLVSVEALACGCHVIGSRVGAIPEIIGEENTVDPLKDTFCQELACIAEKVLADNERACLGGDYSWDSVVAKEEQILVSL